MAAFIVFIINASSCLIFLPCIIFTPPCCRKKKKKKRISSCGETICKSYHILTLWTLCEIVNQVVIYRRCTSQLTWQHCSSSSLLEATGSGQWQFWSSVFSAARRLICTRTWIPRSPDRVSWKIACCDAAVSADLKDEVGDENSNISNKRNPLFSEQDGAAE